MTFQAVPLPEKGIILSPAPAPTVFLSAVTPMRSALLSGPLRSGFTSKIRAWDAAMDNATLTDTPLFWSCDNNVEVWNNTQYFRLTPFPPVKEHIRLHGQVIAMENGRR